MKLHGRVHRVGDHIDTDLIMPGRYLTLRDEAVLGTHCLEGLDPDFAQRVARGDILVAGRNFGSGSSREHAVLALRGAGIAAVVAESVARIFYRNAINLALPVITCPEAASALVADVAAEVDVAAGEIRQDGKTWRFPPFQGEVAAILAAGGLASHVRRRVAATDSGRMDGSRAI
jgi:3-isopropylmalate/(R)-2-methylmalate dehydratase small subunit